MHCFQQYIDSKLLITIYTFFYFSFFLFLNLNKNHQINMLTKKIVIPFVKNDGCDEGLRQTFKHNNGGLLYLLLVSLLPTIAV